MASAFGILVAVAGKGLRSRSPLTRDVSLVLCQRCVQRWRTRAGRLAVRELHASIVCVNDQREEREGEGAVEPSQEELGNEEPWLQEEIKAYYRGRKKLAEMMGRDPQTFSDQDVKESLRYLLPTRLSDEQARPFLKHPSEVFPKRQESAFDASGRPLEPGFFTGSPAYHNLIYQIYQHSRELEEAEQKLSHGLEGTGQRPSQGLEGEEQRPSQGLEGEEQRPSQGLEGEKQRPSQGLEAEGSSQGLEAEGPSQGLEAEGSSQGLEAVGSSQGLEADGPSQGLEAVGPSQGLEAEGSSQGLEGEGSSLTKEVEDEVASGKSVPMYWVRKDSLAGIMAEEISDKQYEDLVGRLRQLAEHPLSSKVEEFLNKFRKPVFVYRTHAKVPQLNEKGEAKAVGKRKTATAEVTLLGGRGDVTINGRPFVGYFPRVEDRQQVLFPFLVAEQLGTYNVHVKVKGGGFTGQAGAIRLGISKALLAFPGNHGDRLEEAGLLVRDPRMVERKKPGQKKARKKFTWVKR